MENVTGKGKREEEEWEGRYGGKNNYIPKVHMKFAFLKN